MNDLRPNKRPSLRRLTAAMTSVVLVLACLAVPARGQASVDVTSLDPSLGMTQYVHDTWTVEDGLPQNAVLTMKEASDGYLWIATQAGLVRFDGLRFEVYDRQDGLGNNEVRSLALGKDGDLWIGTHGGGLTHMAEHGTTTYTAEDGLQSNLVRALHRSRDGTLWIGTIEGGLARFDGQRFEQFDANDGLAGNVVLAIEETDDGKLWIGTEAGLTIYDGRTFSTVQDERIMDRLVWAIEPAVGGGYWVGLSGGLALLRDGRVTAYYAEEDGLCGNVVDALLVDRRGTLWIGTLGGGLCRLVGETFETMREEDGLASNRVRSLLEDREGNVWIGTEAGLTRLRQGKFIHTTAREGLAGDMVMTVLEDEDGALWVGTKSHGLTRIRGAEMRQVSTANGLPSNYVSALDAGKSGLWIGMYGGGACRLDVARLQCVDRADGLPSSNVYAVLEDDDGRVWIGTDAGLRILEDGQLTVPENEALASEQISVIHLAENGDIWIAAHGVYVVRGETVRRLDDEQGLTDVIVTVLFEDVDGTMWAGTYGAGLCRVRDDDVRCLTTEQGLLSDQMLQVIVDDRRMLWMGTQQGLARISLSDLSDVLEGRKATLGVEQFGRADGAEFTEVNGGTQPSSWKLRDGRLAFATNYGLAMVDPSTIRTNPVAPAVHVEAIDANGGPVSDIQDVRLAAGTKDMHIRYTGISFTAPEEVRFKYRLEGYDADWVDAGSRREAYYTNLAPGDYTFRVIAANNDGVWNEEGDSVTFYLEPYFYETWWFALLCGLLAVALTAAGYRLRIRHLRERERELEQQVDERTRDLRIEKERTEEAKVVIEGQADQLRDLNSDLEEQAEKLRDLNENLQTKVQEQFDLLVKERERYESDLIDAKERAEASDRLKTAILNNLSHEFRTPLTAILGFTEIIAMEAPDDLQEFTGEIDRGGKRLLRTLDALLEFSRLEANESGMSPTSVDLTTTAFSVVRDLKKVAEKKDLPLHFKASSPIRAHLDVGALEEIVWNLVDNAIKFTREGSVEVTTGTDGDRAFIRVIDTGVGIGEDFRERMYDAFAQESDGFDRAFEGVGLGLTITRRLVEHMGGEIEVETAVGEGSTFTVYFPVTASVAANGTDPLTAAAAAPQTDAAAASDPATAAANDPATAPEKESPNKPVK